MKRKTIILFIILVLATALLMCFVTCGKKDKAPAAEQTERTSNAATPIPSPSEPTIEDATVVVDGENGSTVEAKMGLADDTIEENLPHMNEESETETPKPSPTTTPEQPHESGSTGLTWEEFNALSPEARDAYKNSFPDFDAFYNWMIAAQEEFKNANPNIEIGPGESVDLSQLAP